MMNIFLTRLILQASQTGDVLLKEGRMYSVLAVLLVIFLALVAYLVLTERKISAVEKRLNEK